MIDNASSIRRDDTPTLIFNPLDKDFSYEYRDDSNNYHTVTLVQGENRDFPAWLADRLIIHITDEYLNERKRGITTPEERAEIEVIIRGNGPKPENLPRNIIQLDKP